MAEDRPPDLDIVLYTELLDTVPQAQRIAWAQLAALLSEHEERSEKDGPGWSATVYRPSTTRGKAGVESVTALVFDIDHGEPVWSLLDGLEYVAHTTWKHHASSKHVDCQGRDDCPHWRIVLPLAQAVPSNTWDAFRASARFWLCPNADESAKDAPRFFWMPTRQIGKPGDTRRGEGHWLNPDELRLVPADEPLHRKTITPPSEMVNGERPGDRFEREADWCRDLLPDWKPVGVHGDNLMMRRPGSTHPYGATISRRGQGVLYVFTDGAPPLLPNTCYSKFWAYAALEHGGNPKVAARTLAERYGMSHRQNGATIGQIGKNGAAPASAVDDEDAEISSPGHRPLTDMGNAERFADRFRDQVVFSTTLDEWLAYDGRHHRADNNHHVVLLAKEVARSIRQDELTADLSDKQQKLVFKHWARSEGAGGVTAMLTLAKAELPLEVGPSKTIDDLLDPNPWLLNVRNGTIDLRTGELREHRREDWITKLLDIDYDPSALAPRWERFLKESWPLDSIREYLHRAAGYSATGSARERRMIVLHGIGRNGKGTLVKTLNTVLGSYSDRAPTEMLMAKTVSSIPSDVAKMRGLRLAYVSEVGEGRRLDEALVKDLTGGEDITARKLYGPWFTFRPTFTMWMLFNHKPIIRGTDRAIWDRLDLIPCDVRFRLEDEPDDGSPLADMGLDAALAEEHQGILAWLVRGAVSWYQNGLGRPAEIRQATSDYRTEMDLVGQFVDECVIEERGSKVRSRELFTAYVAWCKTVNEKEKSEKSFALSLLERGLTKRSDRVGAWWVGLRLRTQMDDVRGDQAENQAEEGV